MKMLCWLRQKESSPHEGKARFSATMIAMPIGHTICSALARMIQSTFKQSALPTKEMASSMGTRVFSNDSCDKSRRYEHTGMNFSGGAPAVNAWYPHTEQDLK